MRKIAFAITLLFAISAGNAQSFQNLRKDSIYLSKLPVHYISLNLKASVSGEKLILPISSIVFRDIRFDTSCIGIQSNRKKGFEKVTLADFCASTANFFAGSGFFSFNQEMPSLLCFVKKMRFIDLDSLGKDVINLKNTRNTKMTFDIEAYIVLEEHFYPAVKLDTSFIINGDVEKRQDFISQSLNLFASKVSKMKLDIVKKRHAYSYNDLEEKYTKRIMSPISRDSILKKGLYASFNEFLNNKPSIKNFEISQGQQKIVTVKTDDNTEYVTRDVFGYCDGNFIWVLANNNFFPVFKTGNSFHFWTTTSHNNNMYIGGLPIPQKGVISPSPVQLAGLAANSTLMPQMTDYVFPYTIDMETGEIY